MKELNASVHKHHYYIKHGCEYNNSNCPVVRGEIRQADSCRECIDEEYQNEPDKNVKLPIRVDKEFFKGFIWAFLIIITIHVGLAYILLL